jgi:tetratricopeptide (TPR) repeat protein/SAM-dependent methyltransferase
MREQMKNRAVSTEHTDVHLASTALASGDFAAAASLAAAILVDRPHDIAALNILGLVALGRNLPIEAIPFFEQVRAARPKDACIQFNLAEAYRSVGEPAQALRHCKKATSLNPEFVEAHIALGDLLRLLGRYQDARRAYDVALQINSELPIALNGLALAHAAEANAAQAVVCFEAALRMVPQSDVLTRSTLWMNLGRARFELGHAQAGILALLEAIECRRDDATGWRVLAIELNNIKMLPLDRRLADLLLQLFRRPDINPRLLASAAVICLKRQIDVPNMLLASEPFPEEEFSTCSAWPQTMEVLALNTLLVEALVSTPIPDLAFELLFTNLRRALLSRGADRQVEMSEAELVFACALARQCFLNEYIYGVTEEEERVLGALRAQIDDQIAQGVDRDYGRMAICSSYAALDASWVSGVDPAKAPEAFRPLRREQIDEPQQELRLARELTTISPISDGVSKAVREQYEESPYPRWTRCQVAAPRPLKDVLRTALPHLDVEQLALADSPRILIAGCGTGIHTMNVLHTYRNARLTAVDLSRRSLCYGQRKLREYGVDGVALLQGDILDLDQLNERFDLIESFGVLHHMEDPERGLRSLAGKMKVDGILFLGLYSELARASIVECRKLAAEFGYPETLAGLRAARRELMMKAPQTVLDDLLSPASDFWTLSECRDLLFHVQEHRFSLGEIGAMLTRCGFDFLGLELRRPSDRARFQEAFPTREAWRSWQVWQEFETRHPQTFGDTYRIWAQKRRP